MLDNADRDIRPLGSFILFFFSFSSDSRYDVYATSRTAVRSCSSTMTVICVRMLSSASLVEAVISLVGTHWHQGALENEEKKTTDKTKGVS